MLKPFIIFLAISIFLQNVHAQEEFIEPPAQHLSRIGFKQLTGGVILMQATVADKPDTLNFILDTGSGGISLDSTTAEVGF